MLVPSCPNRPGTEVGACTIPPSSLITYITQLFSSSGSMVRMTKYFRLLMSSSKTLSLYLDRYVETGRAFFGPIGFQTNLASKFSSATPNAIASFWLIASSIFSGKLRRFSATIVASVGAKMTVNSFAARIKISSFPSRIIFIW